MVIAIDVRNDQIFDENHREREENYTDTHVKILQLVL